MQALGRENILALRTKFTQEFLRQGSVGDNQQEENACSSPTDSKRLKINQLPQGGEITLIFLLLCFP
jgi:hypothetical protein